MNKQLTLSQAVSQLANGMTLGIGGWGPRRKPMALVREILRSGLRDLTIVSYGGPDVGMLCAAGKVKKLVFGFVTMDALPLDPHFRKAREAGSFAVMELDEGMFQWGLRAAAMRLPFLPTRCGLATDIVKRNPEIRMVRSPYADGEELLAMPALKLDAALIHVNSADRLGNTLVTSVDPFFDDLFARAAERCYVSCDTLVDRLELDASTARNNFFERSMVSGVVHAPGGAHPTYNGPDYGWDLEHMKRYSAAAEPGGWETYMREFVTPGEDAYQAGIGGAEHLSQLKQPIF